MPRVRRSRRKGRLAGGALSLLAAVLSAWLWLEGDLGRPRIDPSSPFYSRAACEAHLALHEPRQRPRGPRIGTWNVRWFPYGTSRQKGEQPGTDIAWLACAIATLDVDVLAVQEFVQDPGGQRALSELTAQLDRWTGGRHRAAFDDCPGHGFQHVGFIYDESRVELRGARSLRALNPGRGACDRGLRPGIGAYARFGAGPDLHLVGVHLDSGQEPRDFGHRQQFAAAIARVKGELSRAERDTDLLVLGDFNSMGCSACTPQVSAAAELAALGAQLEEQALARLPLPAERACTHYYRGDTAALDHVVAAHAMDELPADARIEVHGPCAELGCERIARSASFAAFDRLSDHCPLVVELLPVDRD